MKSRIQEKVCRRGVALVYAIFAVFIAASLVSIMLTVARVANASSGIKRYGGEARYLAEGALEAAKKDLQTALASWSPVPATGIVTIDGVDVRYTIAPTGFQSTVTDPAGIQTIVSGYEIRAFSSVQRNAATVHRIVNAEATPIFQFAVFYDQDLEIQPGADMTLSGRVHSNGNMYLGSNATLTVNTNYLRSVGDIYRHRKDDPSQSQGTVRVRRWVANPFDASEPVQYVRMNSRSQMSGVGVSTVSGFDSNFTTAYDANGNGDFTDTGDWLPWGPGALEYWSEPTAYLGGSGSTVHSADHGMSEAVAPPIGSLAMYEPAAGGDFVLDPATNQYVPCAPGTGTHAEGYYHANADLSILTFANGTWKAFDGAGIDVTSALAGVVSIDQMYDARQANGTNAKVKVTEVDIGALTASGLFPQNGLLYAAHYGEGTGIQAKGLRLTNGAVLPDPLTVVSADPIYVHGDYNVGDATHAKQGAAVIGDAINLLSKAWNDSKTQGTLPVAQATTYNVAMITGNQESAAGSYNGGLENLPRFHENWSGVTCTIRGSFVNAFESQYATGAWVYGGDRYQAPRRDWMYDRAFNDVENLPPFTPMVVSARDVVSW
jgi:hypothetical protein